MHLFLQILHLLITFSIWCALNQVETKIEIKMKTGVATPFKAKKWKGQIQFLI